MDKKVKRNNYIKITLMILLPALFLWYKDVAELNYWRTDSPIAIYFSIGVICSLLVWLSFKDRELKRRVYFIYGAVYWVLMFYLLVRGFNFRFDDIWYYYHSFGIFVTMLVMAGMFWLAYHVGMKPAKGSGAANKAGKK